MRRGSVIARSSPQARTIGLTQHPIHALAPRTAIRRTATRRAPSQRPPGRAGTGGSHLAPYTAQPTSRAVLLNTGGVRLRQTRASCETAARPGHRPPEVRSRADCREFAYAHASSSHAERPPRFRTYAWRGQNDASYKVSSSLYRRLERTGQTVTEKAMRAEEIRILEEARRWGLGRDLGPSATDLHLLALLQHPRRPDASS
jgi:hypothetical protein